MPTDKLTNVNGGKYPAVLYSIITPVFNRADCVCRCMDSVVRNLCHGISIEHIIVDDGSKDETPVMVQEYADKYSHIHFIRFSHNCGTNTARNSAVKAAKGKFCIILDSDDFFVDDAIKTIHEVVESKPDYRHYLFTPDDMIPRYGRNFLLAGRSERVLSFVDFLSGSVDGDFVHVVSTEIMRKYPFDESLRIYEGVFFLRFYREAKRLFFTNKIVTIRERSREDSVTREVFRTSKNVIMRIIKATTYLVEWFYKDYEALGLQQVLYRHYLVLVENNVLLGKYPEAWKYITILKKHGVKIPFHNRLIYMLRLGLLYRVLIKSYLIFKYNICGSKLK